MFENISQLRIDLLRDRSDLRIPDQTEHDRRLGRLDVHGAVIALEDVDVAGKEDPDGRLGLQCPMRQRWVARAENEVGLALDPSFFLSVAWMSISVKTPKPAAANAWRTRVVTSPTETPSIRFV